MTIHFGQGKLEAHERQAILEEVYQQAKGAATAAVKAVIEALLEAEVTAKLGREKGAVRHISGQGREVDWVCGQCGSQMRSTSHAMGIIGAACKRAGAVS